MLYLEGHYAQTKETFESTLKENFSRVEYIGTSNDHNERPLFRCFK